MGSNNNGQLGLGYLSEKESNIKIITTFIEENTKIVSINCGQHHAVCVDEAGNIWTWGLNDNHQCCPNADYGLIIAKPCIQYMTNKIFKAEAGDTFTVYLDDNGYYGGFGKIIVSTLDRANITEWDFKGPKYKDLSCGTNHIMLIGDDDNIYCHGSNEFSKCGVKTGRVAKPTKVKYDRLPNDLQPHAIIAGTHNSIIIYNSITE